MRSIYGIYEIFYSKVISLTSSIPFPCLRPLRRGKFTSFRIQSDCSSPQHRFAVNYVGARARALTRYINKRNINTRLPRVRTRDPSYINSRAQQRNTNQPLVYITPRWP